MYQALYRKYRPQTFDDMVGQQAVTQTLKTQLQTGKLSHAYLFTGSRGTGKTTAAKVLAKAVNCLDPHDGNPCNRCSACRAIDSGSCMDVLEIDAASNNGVDNVRDLRDDAVYTPAQVKMRVYIIDEVHMLSISAFNALLKIIEEPPEHLLFVLATTELHKVPATILSRCQRFAFRRIGPEDIAARLQYVAYQENIDLTDDAARLLARLADGGMRDGLSLLDQCASATQGELNAQRVYSCLGIAGLSQCAQLMERIAQRDSAGALRILNQLYADGKDMGALLDELICLSRDLLVMKTAPKEGIGLLSGVATDEQIRDLTGRFSPPELVRILQLLQQTLSGFKGSAGRRMDAELCLISLCQPELTMDLEAFNARLGRLEEQLCSGAVNVLPTAEPQPQPLQEEVLVQPQQPPQVANPLPQSAPQELPVGFWTDVSAQVRSELKPPLSGFFAPNLNSPIQPCLQGQTLTLVCSNAFTASVIDKPEVLALVARKASAALGTQLRVRVSDSACQEDRSGQMQQLIDFGKAHSDLVNIKD